MQVRIFSEVFEDSIKTNSGLVNYKIIYPRTEYPIRTEAQMKLNDEFLASALSKRSFVRNLIAKQTQKNDNKKYKKDTVIDFCHETKCTFIHPMFLSFTEESFITSSGKLIRFTLSSKTYKSSSGQPYTLEKLFRYRDIKPLLWEQVRLFGLTGDESGGYEDFILRYDPRNYYLTVSGICLYFTPNSSHAADYAKVLIPYTNIRSALAYELW